MKHRPQLKVLDRHPITVDERIKAEKMDPNYERKASKIVKKEKKSVKVSQAFSKGEKDLYKEIK